MIADKVRRVLPIGLARLLSLSLSRVTRRGIADNPLTRGRQINCLLLLSLVVLIYMWPRYLPPCMRCPASADVRMILGAPTKINDGSLL